MASGSYRTLGMIVAPCSVRTMSEIATGVTASLLTRAADVTLKERRPLVLMVRETPLHLGHLRTMVALAEMGATIAPPLPAFYARPQSLADMVDQSVGRALDLFGLAWAPRAALGRRVSLWDFALTLYARPGVQAAGLTLQDEHGQSVPLLIWRLWANDRRVDAATLRAAAGLACDWEARVVAPLRTVRRAPGRAGGADRRRAAPASARNRQVERTGRRARAAGRLSRR